ncbi:MAG: CHAP domain-containing protein [Bacilli bacterium]|nr:CHAP domain-containing protein [Bacilli bacterium]
MNNNAERDTKKTIDRLSTVSSSASSNTFDLIDKGAKKLSDVREERILKTQEEENNENDKESESRLKTSENAQETANTEVNEKVGEESASRIKTNVNSGIDKETKSPAKGEGISESESTPKASKLKTSVSNVVQKTFKFNDNQGKVSKAMTVVSKTGSKVSKAGRTITRTSRELNKAMSSDGTGMEYVNDKIGRKVKTKGYKIAKKGAKKVKKKFAQTIGKKLVQVAKAVIMKLIKLLISLFAALAEFIIPIALVILIIVALGSIFGSGSSDDKTIDSYSSYMKSVQEEYNKQVDDWKKSNPKGIVVGVKGDYGQIDWRIPLAIIQSTGAELKFDSDEKDLLETFKKAGLFEKHEVVYQEVDSDSESEETKPDLTLTNPSLNTPYTPSAPPNTIPVLVITNSVYEDYLEWLEKNYTKISNFNKNKEITDGSDTWFSDDQIEMLELLYQSDDYAELLGDSFITHTPVYGKNETPANLKSDNYNSKNTLATSGFKGQCTWFSFGRALEISGKKMPTGNAQTWLASAVAMGYKTGTQPSANSVVVMMGHKFGHVAYVEAYDGKSITISEGNVGNKCSNDDSCSQVEYANNHADELVRTKTYSSYDAYRKATKNNGLTVVGFIYLD